MERLHAQQAEVQIAPSNVAQIRSDHERKLPKAWLCYAKVIMKNMPFDFDANKGVGLMVALFYGLFVGLVFGITTFFGDWAGVYGTLTGDLTLLAYIITAIFFGAIALGTIGGYLGINDKANGAKCGALAGLGVLAAVLLYMQFTGQLTWTFPDPWTIVPLFEMLLCFVLGLVFMSMAYKVGKDAVK